MLNPHIFRAYDVRGLVGPDINAEVFAAIGRAFGTLLARRGGPRGRRADGLRVALGRDNRVASAGLAAAFGAGVRAAGVDTVTIGEVPTPLLYFATAHWGLDGGATVTGSHNPVTYNGVKLVWAGAEPLAEEDIQELRTLIEAGDFATGAGTDTARDPRPDYARTVTALVQVPRRLRVVVDAGNGIAGTLAPGLLRGLGCDIVELHCESDGRFPHHLPDPEEEANVEDLKAAVVTERADVGIAWDGDADRVGVVDERGRRHEADLVLALLAREYLARRPGATVIFDVKCSQVLVDDIARAGGVPLMWKTGHAHLKRKMRADGILLGGEVSGHLFFGERYYGVDDGILAAAKILAIAAGAPGTLGALFDTLPHLPSTPELKAPCPDGDKFRVVAEVAAALRARYPTLEIDGARVTFPDGGWGLVRASNTNPYLTLRFEGPTEAAVRAMQAEVYGLLARYPFVTLPR